MEMEQYARRGRGVLTCERSAALSSVRARSGERFVGCRWTGLLGTTRDEGS